MGRHSSFDKQAVLESALTLFWSKGFSATSLRQLEEVTELHPGSLYHHFKSKEGLYVSVLKYYLEHEMPDRINRYLTGNAPLSGIRRFFTSGYRNPQEQHYRNCCFLACSSAELHLLPQEAQSLINKGMMDIQDAFEKQLGLLTRQGYTFSQEINDIAKHLSCLFLGLQLFARIQSNQHQLDSIINNSLQQLLPHRIN
ncbi:hypothetical protein GZ77_19675 [Endozoicomonas montiporae]|uniref:HTH tetR-type domain-containing protein n=2 Tax=Endozoicomonas montiporae TaxID=1027273 RepID=A0A081N2M9_9GAMM|nr:TetR/AcrR family transcriptional regulator [Endozoicomonas montiporae]AMO57960.1 TetR family transcriptional regulator [Endozoicomonas montiporae CL-33]KEQ12702.1 hypothetical protein GZ77_19675 [Endozoicomonas montiporae]